MRDVDQVRARVQAAVDAAGPAGTVQRKKAAIEGGLFMSENPTCSGAGPVLHRQDRAGMNSVHRY